MARVSGFWKKIGTAVEPAFQGGADLLLRGVNRYLNFGEESGEAGYGIRDNNGILEYKNSAGTWVAFSSGGGGGGGVTDHGALTGLADDDHTQYHTDARGDARYSQLGHTHTIADVTGLQTALDAKVTGPASATDNAIPRFDGATGKLIQNSGATISDAGVLNATSKVSAGVAGTTRGTIDLLNESGQPVLFIEGFTGGVATIGTNSGTTRTLNITNTGAGLINVAVEGDLSVADEAYDATAWNGSLEVPTKNAIRDKIDTMDTAIAGKANTTHSHVIADTTGLQTALDAKANTSSLAPVATSGAYADLTGLPDLSVFDEVEQYANLAAFPGTGNVTKFYLAQDTGLLYRWTGSAYAVISAELALGETSTTAYRGDRGKIAFDHTSLTNNPHSVTKAQVGLGNADNTSDLAKPISTATQTALDGKANTSHTHTASQVTDFNEAAQDAVGTILTDTTSIDLIYDDAGNTISAQREALTGDVTAPKNSNATTLATVNSNVGSFGLAGSVAQFTVNAKGLITAAANVAISITASAVTDFAATVRATVLTGLSVATSTAVTATDSILVAIGKLQAQNTAQDTAIAGKANTSHTHVIADTTGLQTALDGKAATSHTHTKSQVTDFQHSITGTEHTFPGGTTTFLRADGTFAAPPSGFADPLTTNGDIIARIAGATTRLPQGANGTFLGVSGGALGYYTPPGGGSGITEAQARTIARRYAVALG